MKQSPNMFVWIDCEMTGLDPRRDTILEIAMIVTNSDLQEQVTVGPLVVGHTQKQLEQMNDEVRAMHTANGLLQAARESTITIMNAQEAILSEIRRYCTPKTGLLAGNSVWQDAQFLRAYMPVITDYLHYRIIDVSTVKTLVCHWYANHPDCSIQKQDTHRALGDIRESITELRFYREHFFIH